MFSRHELTCQRPGCGQAFTARRSDARFCSRSCRRAKLPPPPPVEAVTTTVDARKEPPEVAEEEDLHGWRRVGPYLIPPFDARNVVRVDDWLQ
jgi:hypothetical protein